MADDLSLMFRLRADGSEAVAETQKTGRALTDVGAKVKDSFAVPKDSVPLLVAEIRKVGEAVKALEPGRLESLASAVGNLGHAAQGAKAVKDLGLTMEHVSLAGQKAGQGVKAAAEGVSGFLSKLPQMLSGLAGGGAGLAALGAAAVVAVGALAVLAAGVVALVAAVGTLSLALPALIDLLDRIYERGTAYNSQLEQTKLGIGAIITSLADLRNAAGRELQGPEALNASLKLAEEQLRRLKVDAVNTTATFAQIAPAFQAAIGPGLRAGLTLDQIRETVVKITQAAGALNIPFEQLNQEVRAILEGTINEDARLAKVLGLSNEMVKSWKEQGTLAEELNKRLAGFAEAGSKAAGTLEGLRSNLKEALDVFAGQATERTFEALKEEFQRLLPQLFDFKNAGTAAQFRELAALADDVLVRLVRIGGQAVQSIVSGLAGVNQFLRRNRDVVDDILELSSDTLRLTLQTATAFGHLAGDTGVWHGALMLVRGTLGLINTALAYAAVTLKAMEPGLKFAALVAASLLAATPGLGAPPPPPGPRPFVAPSDLRGGTGEFAVSVTARPGPPDEEKKTRRRKSDAEREEERQATLVARLREEYQRLEATVQNLNKTQLEQDLAQLRASSGVETLTGRHRRLAEGLIRLIAIQKQAVAVDEEMEEAQERLKETEREAADRRIEAAERVQAAIGEQVKLIAGEATELEKVDRLIRAAEILGAIDARTAAFARQLAVLNDARDALKDMESTLPPVGAQSGVPLPAGAGPVVDNAAFEEEFGKPPEISPWQEWAVGVAAAISDVSAQIGNFGTLTRTIFDQIAGAVASVVKNFVLFGTAGTSFRKFAAEVIASVAAMAATKAVFELAEGFAMLALTWFTGNPRFAKSAGDHFVSAAIYGTVAGIAAAAGRAVAGGAFASGGSGGGGGAFGDGSSPAYEDERTRRSREQMEKDKNTRREDRREEVHIFLHGNEEFIIDRVTRNYNNGGPVRSTIRRDLLGEPA